MSKIKFLYIIITLLVITNVGVLVSMFLNHPPHRGPKAGPQKVIIERLHFDESQAKKYHKIIENHQLKIAVIEKSIRENKDALFSELKTNNHPMKDSIISNLETLQGQIENAHYTHFENIKKLCTKDQLVLFDELTNEMGRLFAPPHPPKKN